MKIEKVPTADGTATLRRTDLNETYHSTHGAVQEGMHVFIKHGLHTITTPVIRLLEVGLGTGLNALLTAVYANPGQKIEYVSLEPNPLKPEDIAELGFDKIHPEAGNYLRQILSTPHYQHVQLTPAMSFEFVQEKIQYAQLMKKFDLIYYDAFGPRAQPEMWDEKAVEAITNQSKPGTVLVTYCAQGQFRRNLESAGWKVEKTEGPPGKREMIRAVKI